MFYSHQLLARKAPLGQIWMAATMHAKINRRKLDKLDIIQICEEILNPSVPMALRLSSILMGGVVIVYERKVKLLYDDLTRFLIEINESWRVKTVADRTVLPKARVQAKYEAVTLPEDEDTEEVERTMRFTDVSGASAARFERMRLEDLEEHYINIDLREEDLAKQHHQTDAANITLFDDYSSHLGGADIFNRFERFDIDEDDEAELNFSQAGQPEIPTTLRPSATPEDEQQPRAENGFIPSHTPQPDIPQEAQRHQADVNEEEKPKAQHQNRQRKMKGKAHGASKRLIMDNVQLMIPGNIYQNWLESSSDIVSKRGRTVKECLRSFNPYFSTKMDDLMNLPPVALIFGLDIYTTKLHYPTPLMTQWKKCTFTSASSPSGDTSASEGPEQQQEPHSPSHVRRHRDLPEFPQEFQTGKESNPLEFSSIEKLRANLENVEVQRFDDAFSSDHYVTPGNSGRSANSTSSGSGNTFMALDPEIRPTSGRSKRRQNSSSRNNLGNLDPVEEEFPLQQDVRGFKIRRLSGDGPTPDLELLVETGPTQTPPYRVHTDHSNDQITQSIRTHLKTHFDTPGAPQVESLSHLAHGMNERQAAKLFYQTCVLATLDFVKVEQTGPYEDILISRGPEM